MKKILKLWIVWILSSITILSVSANELDMNEAANNVDIDGIKVNDYESGDVEIWGSKVNASEWTMQDWDYKVDAEAGEATIDWESYKWEWTEMEWVGKLGKVWMEWDANANAEANKSWEEVELNAAPVAAKWNSDLPETLPKTWAEEILILMIALMLWAMFMIKSKKTS